MPPKRIRKTQKPSSPIVCPQCGQELRGARGLSSHRSTCNTRKKAREDLARDARIHDQRKRAVKGKENLAPRKAPQITLPLPTPPPPDVDSDVPMPDADPPQEPAFALRTAAGATIGPRLPSRFILTVPHPHAHLPSKIVSLENPSDVPENRPLALPFNPEKPHAPFRTYADYHFTSKCVKRAWPDKVIQQELDDLHGNIYKEGPSKLTIRNVKDMSDSLRAARQLTVEFKRQKVRVDYREDAETDRFRNIFEVELDFRDSWEVAQSWARDPTLAAHSTWFSEQKYYCKGDFVIQHQEPLYDEPCTGNTWQETDNELPDSDPTGADPTKPKYPAIYLPLHIWLDKGQVSTKVKKHPILLRGLWIHSSVRNGSGNGGGALLGYIVMPASLRIDPKTLTAAEREDLTKLRGRIYNAINSHILGSTKIRTVNGATFKFGDGVFRTAIPGILIQSMDFQEIAAWLAMCSSQAKYPCPKCLVPSDQLEQLTKHFAHRTIDMMRRTLAKARRQLTKGDKERVLRGKGMHDVEQIQWDFQRSDPYKAVSYDTLHWAEGGTFGRHLWVVVKQTLTDLRASDDFNKCMAAILRWSGMERISHATLIDFTEGNTFLQMLNNIVLCLVHFLPANSPLIHALRALQQFQMLVGMHCTTERRLQLMERFVCNYGAACRKIPGKDFNFLKQHYTQHAAKDIREKGTTNHMSTRPGEGFQQEVNRAYQRTNGRDAEQQMVVVDANEEAMAKLDLIVADDAERKRRATEDAEDGDVEAAPESSDVHWRYSAAERPCPSGRYELNMTQSGRAEFDGFDVALRVYLAQIDPENTNLDFHQVQAFRGVHINFQSKMDWSAQRDILRCNPKFQGEPRFDCVIFNAEDDPLSLARLLALLRVTTHDGTTRDLAYVRTFKAHTAWKPRTVWDGCHVVEEGRRPQFLPLEHVERGALLAIDMVDDDMFLRLNNID
ncbi:hypothetical protein GGX14DRAFT_563480 [Mycena pura]|uniref:Uncharacterized protein n=1 Tax=Mycena pura TaxID=153505 RepID=A0AAD6VK40_9AGAR|nr:hypothetical protein GGX14DRAFT_563480 [Mycena pura]